MRKRVLINLCLVLANIGMVMAQTSPQQLEKFLATPLETHDEVEFQGREYLMSKVAKLKVPASAGDWTAEEQSLRKHWLDVMFRGWPQEWVNSPPKFEDAGLVPGGVGYKMRKLRYEVVPGFWSTAILYVPDNIQGKVSAILNVNGHEYVLGKAADYKQKRCINFAKHGIIALSLEWLECGELYHGQAENSHWNAAYLDFVGANAVGLFYLEMRRGIDYLYNLPEVDQSRIGVTGLSGGGWQTITLSALDPRVAVAVPVAGYASMVSEIERPDDAGDIEQTPTDFFAGLDNTFLTALRAPRPTLLIYNDEDNCCFRAPLVKPYVYGEVQPIFKLYGKEDDFQWHDNQDPGTHNYELDNRLQAYRFFSTYFHLPPITSEFPVGSELRTYQQLVVGLPKDNLTFLGLAKEMATKIRRSPIPDGTSARATWAAQERTQLKDVIHYSPEAVKHAWAVNGFVQHADGNHSFFYTESDLPQASFIAKGIEVKSYRFEFNNELSATGMLMKSLEGPAKRPITIVLNDQGKSAMAAVVSDHVNLEERVLAADLLLTGDAAPPKEFSQPEYLVQLLATLGDRALGIEVAQLLATTHWVSSSPDSGKIQIDCTGPRSEMVVLIAAALQPEDFSRITIHKGISSLGRVLMDPISHRAAPDLFCLDLYKEVDVDRLIALASPVEVSFQDGLEADTK